MHGDLLAGTLDAHLLAHEHRDALANQPPRHAVAVGFDLDARVRVHAPHALAKRLESGTAHDRPKRGSFLALEALERRLAGGAMDSHVGHLAHPPRQVRCELNERFEAMTGDSIALHVAHAALVLALG